MTRLRRVAQYPSDSPVIIVPPNINTTGNAVRLYQSNIVSAGSLSGTPNKPAGYTTIWTLDMSQTPPQAPPNNDSVDYTINSEFGMIYYGQNWSQVTDATAPQSPSTVWQGHWPTSSGTLGTGGGHGIGNIFTGPAINWRHLYVSVHMKFDSSYTFHPISNKWLNISGQVADTSWINSVVQLYESGYYFPLNELSPLNQIWATPQINTPITTGVWHRFEVIMDLDTGVFKVWNDGVLVNDQSALPYQLTGIRGVGIYAFRGGGEEDGIWPGGDWYYDEITFAT